MALSEFEIHKCERAIQGFLKKRRPHDELRDQLDLGCRLENQSVFVFEVRPVWNDPSRTAETPVAKTTFVKTQKVWRIYWQRADLKWHRYDPDPEVDSVEKFFDIVDKDEYCCFFG